MFIIGRPVIHMFDEATHFSAASLLGNQSTKEIRRTNQRMWSLVYSGPPDYLVVDHGSAYTSKEMKESLEAFGASLDEAPIENPGAIGAVKRYHAPLRMAYERIQADTDRQTSGQKCLQLAVLAINCTVGPEDLCPALLVFGAIPRPAKMTPAPLQMERARLIDRGRDEVEKEQAQRKIAFGLKHKGGQKGKEHSIALRNLPASCPRLVYRSSTKRWEAPYKFISIEGETVVVQLNQGRRMFRSSCIKPMVTPMNNNDVASGNIIDSPTCKKSHCPLSEDNFTLAARAEVDHKSQDKLIKGSNQDIEYTGNFAKSRVTEPRGLIDNGTFEIVDSRAIRMGTRIFGSRFIDSIKHASTGVRYKSRLVAQNYGDENSASIETKAPTVQRFTQSLLLYVASSSNDISIHTKDITQAYIQSRTSLEREIYIVPPVKMELPPDKVLKVIKQLYGIPESGLHWYLTYVNHHEDNLKMMRSQADPCLLYKRDKGRLVAMVILQVDASIIIGSETLLEMEEKGSQAFVSKARLPLQLEPSLFNGLEISLWSDGAIRVTRKDKIKRLEVSSTNDGFKSQRALAQYIGVCCRPDVYATVQLIAPRNNAVDHAQFKSLRKAIEHLKRTCDIGLDVVELDMESVRIVVLSDASFPNAYGKRSQLGYLILMADGQRPANIVHYGSSRCHCASRSVMAAEVHALVHAFHNGFIVREALAEPLGRAVELKAFVDSRTLFNVIAKGSNTAEKRFQINLFALK